MALEVCMALIGAPEKGDAVIIGLEDGRSLSLTYGTTKFPVNAWQILPPDDFAEVNQVLAQHSDDPITIAGDLICTVDNIDTIAVGRFLGIVVTSRVSDEVQATRTKLQSAVATITIV